MREYNFDEYKIEKYQILKKIKEGSIFIHPSDTIYRMGCDASNEESVKRMRLAKEQYTMPFSVIAPSKEWIRKNCEVDEEGEKWLEKLPGPYTLIFRLKTPDIIAPSANLGTGTIGVRIPDHWFSETAKLLNVPIITTSVNKIGRGFMTRLSKIDGELKRKIDFAIYEGPKPGKACKIVNLAGEIVLPSNHQSKSGSSK